MLQYDTLCQNLNLDAIDKGSCERKLICYVYDSPISALRVDLEIYPVFRPFSLTIYTPSPPNHNPTFFLHSSRLVVPQKPLPRRSFYDERSRGCGIRMSRRRASGGAGAGGTTWQVDQ